MSFQVKESEEHVDASFCLAHVGHACDAAKLSLSRQDWQTLELLFTEKIKIERIMEICQSYGKNSRLYYCTKPEIEKYEVREPQL